MACGEVQWNLRATADGTQRCRVCDEELRPERRRPGRRFAADLPRERRDTRPGAPA